MLRNTGSSSANPGAESTESDSERGEQVERPKPVLANATYLLDNTKALMNEQSVDIHPNHIPTDYSSDAEAGRAKKIANNLRLDMNMFYEEHIQRELEHNSAFTEDAKTAVKLIHDKLSFASLDMDGSRAIQADVDLREEQIKHLTGSLESSYPPGKLREFLEKNDWSESNFNGFLGSFTGEGARARQYADTGMKVLKQIKTQVPYFGGSVEYQQNVKSSLEYYIYHISTLTRDANQQHGYDTPQGELLPKDLKPYKTKAEGEVPFYNQRNLGTGVTESRFEGLPNTLQKQIEVEMEHLRANPNNGEQDRADALQTFVQPFLQPDKPNQKLSAQDIWNGSNEDAKKKLFADILLLPWSEAHLHGGEGYEQVTVAALLQKRRSTSRIRKALPSRPNDQQGLMNVAGVDANVLEKPHIAGKTYANDPRFARLETVKERGELHDLFPGAVPQDQTLRQEFVEKHQNWHDRAMANAKPQIGGISGHTLGYMNLYAEALEKVPASDRGQYPSLERLRAIMLAGLIGTKRHHSYDEVMSASTGAGKGSIPAESYRTPASYGDVLDSSDPEIKACALAALEKAKKNYVRENNTVLKTITESLAQLFPDEAQAKTKSLTDAVGQYLEGLGHDPDTARLSTAVAVSLKARPVVSVAQRVGAIERRADNERQGRPLGRRF